ncbi:MAG: TetR/AcrR family transcriptional regulator [Pseudomonadota bacterium]
MTEMAVDKRITRAIDQRKQRKGEIVKAARRLISEKGYAATSIADILEVADISRGTFYTYFESREALFHDLVDDFARRLMACIQPVKKNAGDPMQLLEANVRRVIDLFLENRDLTVILLREAVAHDRLVDQKLQHLYAFLHHNLVAALENGAAWGLIRKVDEKLISVALLGSIKEVLYQYLVVKKEPLPDTAAISRELVNFGLRGLVA